MSPYDASTNKGRILIFINSQLSPISEQNSPESMRATETMEKIGVLECQQLQSLNSMIKGPQVQENPYWFEPGCGTGNIGQSLQEHPGAKFDVSNMAQFLHEKNAKHMGRLGTGTSSVQYHFTVEVRRLQILQSGRYTKSWMVSHFLETT